MILFFSRTRNGRSKMSITESIRTTVHVHFKKSVKSAIFWKWRGSKSIIWHKFCFHDEWVRAWFCYRNYNIANKRHSANASNAHRLVQVGSYDESGFHIFPSKDESSREASHWFQNTLKVMDLGNDDVRDYSRTQYQNQLFVLIF